jgi:ribosome biogenesis GTPase
MDTMGSNKKMHQAGDTVEGLLVQAHGRLFRVEVGEHIYVCTTRSKRHDYVCGDKVQLTLGGGKQAVIESVAPRFSLLYRQDGFKSKQIAANVTRLVIVTAAEPAPNEYFINRCLVAAEAANIAPLIVLNKADLPATSKWQATFESYRALGYPVLTLSAAEGDLSDLLPFLQGQTSLLIGQSGVGKSTLTNVLIPHANTRVKEISTALNSGKHTTTHATLYHLDADSHLVDSPGLQSFGLHHLPATDLIHYFPDFRPFIGLCRFHNCSHLSEPNCAIKLAAEENPRLAYRLAFYQQLSLEVSAT